MVLNPGRRRLQGGEAGIIIGTSQQVCMPFLPVLGVCTWEVRRCRVERLQKTLLCLQFRGFPPLQPWFPPQAPTLGSSSTPSRFERTACLSWGNFLGKGLPQPERGEGCVWGGKEREHKRRGGPNHHQHNLLWEGQSEGKGPQPSGLVHQTMWPCNASLSLFGASACRPKCGSTDLGPIISEYCGIVLRVIPGKLHWLNGNGQR